MRIAIVGLGYVGIQLAVALGRKHQVVGLDLDEQKITDYQANYDATGEVSEAQLRAATNLEFTTQPSDLKGCDIFIIAVPTPVDSAKKSRLRSIAKCEPYSRQRYGIGRDGGL